MPVRVGCALSQRVDARVGAIEAATEARNGLDGHPADLVVVFVSGSNMDQPEDTLEGIHEALAPGTLIGCGAAGLLAGGRELEDGSGVVVWAAHLDGGSATSFHADVEDAGENLRLTGLPEVAAPSSLLLLPDPVSFPTEPVLAGLPGVAPGVAVLGGLASGRNADGAVLLRDDEVLRSGAVGVRLDGCELLPCVSQGALPVGPELTITAADGNIITELAGRPALQALQDAIGDLDAVERSLVANGLLLGVVVNGDKPDYLTGDFLVRGLVGADPDTGTVAVAAPVRAGQVVRLHARDADLADRDLRDALALRREALGGQRPAGALVFSCNGRGRGMFGHADHDAEALQAELGAPAGGFFAAGEIGPVGGEPFLHSFTATVAVFAR